MRREGKIIVRAASERSFCTRSTSSAPSWASRDLVENVGIRLCCAFNLVRHAQIPLNKEHNPLWVTW